MKKLTQKELNLAVEAILFASCADVCADWNEEDSDKLVDIAIKLKGEKEISLEKIKLFGMPIIYENKKRAKNIKQNFKIKTEK